MRGVFMDFLEGFLLGPVWSDTEYETHRHTGFYWLIGWIIFGGYVWLQLLKPAAAEPWLNLPRYAPIIYFFLLTLASPFACRYYYRVNPLLKGLILLLEISKFLAAFLSLYQYSMPLYMLNLDTLPQTVLEYVNKTVAGTTESFQSLGQGVGMLVGLAGGGLLVVLTFLGILLAATLIPAFYLAAARLIQRGVDMLAHHFLLHDIDA